MIEPVYERRIGPYMSAPKLKVVNGQLVGRDLTPQQASGLPTPRRLTNMQDVKRDAIAVYRAGRKGKIDSSEVSRWMFSVGKLSDVIEQADVEPRVAAIEARLEAIAKKLQL